MDSSVIYIQTYICIYTNKIIILIHSLERIYCLFSKDSQTVLYTVTKFDMHSYSSQEMVLTFKKFYIRKETFIERESLTIKCKQQEAILLQHITNNANLNSHTSKGEKIHIQSNFTN